MTPFKVSVQLGHLRTNLFLDVLRNNLGIYEYPNSQAGGGGVYYPDGPIQPQTPSSLGDHIVSHLHSENTNARYHGIQLVDHALNKPSFPSLPAESDDPSTNTRQLRKKPGRSTACTLS